MQKNQNSYHILRNSSYKLTNTLFAG